MKYALQIAGTITLALLVSTAAQARQNVLAIDGDDFTLRGCVGRATPATRGTPDLLVWTRGDIMLNNVVLPGGPAAASARVFYWLDDKDDLAEHVGQMVEIKGDVGDFKTGEIEVDRHDDFTEVEMKLDGKKEKARIPTSWLGGQPKDGTVDFVARKIDVDDVKVLGACDGR